MRTASGATSVSLFFGMLQDKVDLLTWQGFAMVLDSLPPCAGGFAMGSMSG